MRGTKQTLSEGLKLARVLLDLRSEHIGEQVAVDLAGIAQGGQLILQSAALGVAVEVGLNSDPGGDVVNERAAATKDVKAGEVGLVGVNVDEREVNRNFELGNVLRHNGQGG